MFTLSNLKDLNKRQSPKKRVGRGIGSGKGKTCGRGHKGDKSRSGYKTRKHYVGGAAPVHKTMPTRGFSRAAFRKEFTVINFDQINSVFEDGEELSRETLIGKGFVNKNSKNLIKVLSRGELTVKIKGVKVNAVSAPAKQALEKAGISVTLEQ